MVWGGGKTDSSIWLDIYYPSKKSFLDLKRKHKAMKNVLLDMSSGLGEELMLLKYYILLYSVLVIKWRQC